MFRYCLPREPNEMFRRHLRCEAKPDIPQVFAVGGKKEIFRKYLPRGANEMSRKYLPRKAK